MWRGRALGSMILVCRVYASDFECLRQGRVLVWVLVRSGEHEFWDLELFASMESETIALPQKDDRYARLACVQCEDKLG